jgi:hypothetical protein
MSSDHISQRSTGEFGAYTLNRARSPPGKPVSLTHYAFPDLTCPELMIICCMRGEIHRQTPPLHAPGPFATLL